MFLDAFVIVLKDNAGMKFHGIEKHLVNALILNGVALTLLWLLSVQGFVGLRRSSFGCIYPTYAILNNHY